MIFIFWLTQNKYILGIRYGKEPSDYISPYIETDQNQVAFYRLYLKYQGKP